MYKNNLIKKKTKNFCFVTIRTDRQCEYCGKVMPRGTRCLTINPKARDRQRFWLCNGCVSLLDCNTKRQILGLINDLNNVAFDDEGAWEATSDMLTQYIGFCIDCGKCPFAEWIEDYE